MCATVCTSVTLAVELVVCVTKIKTEISKNKKSNNLHVCARTQNAPAFRKHNSATRNKQQSKGEQNTANEYAAKFWRH